MARVTLVVNSAREASETFLHRLAATLLSHGHDVAVHQLMPGAALMTTDGSAGGYQGAVRGSDALPALRSRSFPAALLRRGLDDGSVMRDAARRAVSRFGRTQRATRAALLAGPILATRPDVVHFAFSPIGVALRDAIELLDPGTRLVVSCRGTGELVRPVLDPLAAEGLAELLRRVDAVHAVSADIAATVARLAPGAPPAVIIRPAVDVQSFRRSEPRRPIGSPIRVVTVSRLHWIKAIEVQLAAAVQLRRAGHGVRWTIVGDGPERDHLRFRSAALGLDDSVEFTGARTPDRVRETVERSDVFVLSSLSEGTSNAVLEAMALEVPVVSSRVGGMAEILSDGVDAMLVAPGDADSLSAAILRLVEVDGLADALAARGRRTVSEGFSSERQGREFGAFYGSLLDGVPAAGGPVS